jgi:CBS domain-containing protein
LIARGRCLRPAQNLSRRAASGFTASKIEGQLGLAVSILDDKDALSSAAITEVSTTTKAQIRRFKMKVSEAMTLEVDIIDPNAAVREAAQRMRDANVGALPVGENDRLIGMVTDRDIVVRAVAENRQGGTTSVRDVMSERVYYCFQDDDLERAAQIMAEHQVRRLPVLNRDKRLVGIVALADLARIPAEAAHKALEGISERSDQPRR